VVESDLFDQLDPRDYDWIIINPPFYPRNPTTESERAWFCGEDFAFFVKLFDQLSERLSHDTNVIMVLSEDCDLNAITTLASNAGLKLDNIFTVNGWWEKNEVYKISTK
jgi:release factor glutamine methyltransferase